MHDGAGEASDGGDALLADQVFARLADGGAHVVEGSGQAADFVFARDCDFDGVILAGHFRRGAVQLFHRLHDAARQQIGQAEPGRHRHAATAG